MNAVEYFDQEVASFHELYTRSRDFRNRYRLWTRLIASYAARARARTCLDLGCGPGLFSLFAAELGITTIGLDPSPGMLQLCEVQKHRRRLDNVRFLRGALPLDPALNLPRADLILCSSVLEYVADWQKCLPDVVNLLTPDGYLLVSLPNGQSVYRWYESARYRLTGQPAYYCHVHHVLPLPTAVAQLECYGLNCVEHHYYGDEPLLSRLAARLCREPYWKNLYVLVLRKQVAVGQRAA